MGEQLGFFLGKKNREHFRSDKKKIGNISAYEKKK